MALFLSPTFPIFCTVLVLYVVYGHRALLYRSALVLEYSARTVQLFPPARIDTQHPLSGS